MVESRGASLCSAKVIGGATRLDRRPVRSSVLALLLAGAAMTATPVGAVIYDLMGATANRLDFIDPTTMTESDFVENGVFNLTLGANLTFNGVLRDGSGVFTFNKLGGGDLTLTGTNTYSGETGITGGSIVAGAVNTLSANSRVRVGTTLELAGYDQTVRGFYQSGSINNTSGGTATLTTNPGVLNSFSGSITETAGNEITLVKIGAGEQNLIGASSYSGGTTLVGGTLGFGHDLAFGTSIVEITGAGAVLKSLGVGLVLANDIVLTADGVIDGSGTSPTLAGVISGAGSLTKINSGALSILNTGNTYSGGTFLQGGSLLLGGNNVLGDVTKALTVGPAAQLGTTGVSAILSNDIIANAQFTLLAPNAQILDIGGVVSGVGSLIIQGTTGTVILRSANTYTGTTSLAGGTLGIADDLALGGADRALSVTGSATLTAYDNLTIANNIRVGAAAPGVMLTVATAGFDLTLSDSINNTTAVQTGGLIKAGNGTLTLGSPNNYSGGTILRGGKLSVAGNNRLGNAIGGLTFDGGTLQITGNIFSTTARAIELLGTGGFEIVDAANSFILGDPITGAGGLVKSGAGALVLAAANSFAGGVTLDAGTLVIQDNNALGTGVATLNGGVLVADAAALMIDNDIVVGTATIDTQANTLTLSGDISGAGTLSKSGTGILILTGANSFAGGSFIDFGEVFVGANGALGSGLATFADGAVLGASANATLGNNLQLDGIVNIATGASTLTLGGVVSGTGSLVKGDAGTLVLNGANSFSGPTTVSTGTVEIGANTALGVGGVMLSNGAVLRAGITGLNPTNAIDLAGSGGTVDTDSLDLTLAGAISGTQLTKAGAGTLTLTAANSHTGGTQLTGGRVAFTNDAAFGTGVVTIGAITGIDNTGDRTLANDIAVNANTVSFLGGTLTLDGVLSGAGRFTAANNTLALNGINTGFGGGISILTGIVEPGNDNAFGSAAIGLDLGTIRNVSGATRTIANAVSLTGTGGVSGTSDVVLNGVVSGAGALDKADATTLTLAGTNTYTGGTNLLAGTIVVDTDTALGVGTLATAGGTTVKFGTTPRTLTIANAVTLNGSTTLQTGGTLLSNDGMTGIFSTDGSAVTLDGAISGIGPLVLAPFSDLSLNAANSFGGTLTVNQSIVRIGSATALGNSSLVLDQGVLTNDSGGALVLANAISLLTNGIVAGADALTLTAVGGGGVLTKLGSGTLTLTGDSTYTGTTFLSQGTLALAGNLGGGGGLEILSVGGTASLTGTGTILGTTTSTGGRIAPGNSAGTLVFSNLTLDAASMLDFELATPGMVGGNNDLIVVDNALTLDGTLNIVALPGFTVGTYRIIDYSGALSGNGLLIGGVPVGFDTANFTISTATPGQINLILALGSTVYWDGANMAGDGIVDGGSGTWDAASTNWTNSTGAVNGSWGSGTGIFQNTGGTVAIASAHSFDLLQFVTTGYLLTDGGGSLTPSAIGEIETQAGVTTTINAAITGADGIMKTGAGTLVLGGANTFAGAITVAAGTLQVTSNTALGNGVFNVGDGTTVVLDTGFANDIAIAGAGGSGGTFVTGSGNATLSGAISSTGSLTKTGSFDLLLSNANNSFAGGTNVQAGIVRVSDSDGFGAGAIAISDNAGIGTSIDGLDIGNAIGLTGQASIDPSNNALTLSGVISGTGALLKTASGMLTLTGANTYSGGTSIGEGTLAIGSDGNLGDVAGGIDFTGTNSKALLILANLTIARTIAINDNAQIDTGAFDVGLSGVVSGDSRLSKQGTGVLTLSGINSYGGGTNIDAGTLSISSDANLGDIAGAVRLGVDGVSGGVLRITGNVTSARDLAIVEDSSIDTQGASIAILDGLVTGTGALTKLGSGGLALSGNNAGFSGGITLAAGTLGLFSDTAAGTGAITTTGSDIVYADGVTIANAIVIDSNTTRLQQDDVLSTQSGVISELNGPRPLTKIGEGILVLSAANTFAGLFTIEEGTIGIANNQALGLGSVALANGTGLQARAAGFAVANDLALTGIVTVDTNGFGLLPATGLSLDGVISGTGTLRKAAAGNTALNGVNTYTGGTQINGGALSIVSDDNLGAVAGNVVFQAAALSALSTTGDFTIARNLVFTNIFGAINTTADSDVIASGIISGAGRVLKAGTGSLTLTNAANSYAQGTLITDGRLNVGSDAVLGTAAGAIVFAGTPNGVLGLTGSFTSNRNLSLAASGTIDTNGFDLALTSNAVGTGTLNKIGAGTLSLLASNIYSGGTNLVGGTIAVGIAGALGTSGLTMASGTTLQAAANVTVGNPIAITGAATIDSQGFTLRLAQPVSGAGSIAKIGNGALYLSNANTYSLGTDLLAGTIEVGDNAAFGTGNVNLRGGTTLRANLGPLTLANTITTNAGIETIDTQGFALTLNGTIIDNVGAGTIAKTGGGLLTLNGVNTYAGGTNLDAGTIVIGNGSAIGTGTLAMAGSTTLRAGATATLDNLVALAGTGTFDTQGFDLTLTNTVGGAGSLTKIGTGTLTLNGANSYTLGTTLDAARITVGNNSALGSGALAMADATALQAGANVTLDNLVSLAGVATIDSQGFSLTLSNVVGGGGSITKIGSGTLTLDAANTYSGGTQLTEGQITIGQNTGLGTGTLDITNASLQAGVPSLSVANAVTLTGNGVVDTQGFDLALTGIVSGTGALDKIDAGTLTLNGVNSYQGITELEEGAIRVTNNLSIGVGTLVASNGTTLISGAPAITLANDVILGGALTLDLTGTTAVLNQMTGSYSSNGSDLTLMGPISGVGSLATANFGTVTLAGVNSFAGGVTATTAQVLVTNAASLGTGALTLADQAGLRNNTGGGLTLANDIVLGGASNSIGGIADLTLGGVIAGAAGFSKVGSDTLTLTGVSNYAGATTVNDGTLRVDGSLTGGGATNVIGGATLTGTGSIAGTVTIGNGAHLAPGNSPGTLAIVGNLILDPSSLVDYELGEANVIGGAFNDRITVTGNLMLGGTLKVTNSNAFGLGVYNLIQYGGALSGNGFGIVSLPGAFTGLVQTLVTGQVNLIVTAPGALVQYWDGGDMAGNGAIDGGSGTWNALNSNWTTAAPSALNTNWQGGVAVFAGVAAGTVTLATPQTAQGLQFTTDGYLLQGAALNFAVPSFIATGGGVTATIAAQITGAGSLALQGTGTLVLNGANSYSGGTSAAASTVIVGSNTALGTGAVALNGTNLAAGVNGLALANAITTTGFANLDSSPGVLTFDGVVSGTGQIIAVGSGNLRLNGANSFAGLSIQTGTVTVGSNTAAGAAGISISGGATLAAGVDGLSLANAVTTLGVGAVNGGADEFTLNGMITGAGSIRSTGSGNLILTGANSFTGLAIANGTVTVGQNTSGGVAGISLANGTTLAAGADGLLLANTVTTSGVGTVDSGAGTLTLAGVLSGAGQITKTGVGNLVLTSANGFDGLTIASGTATIGTNTAAGTGGIAIGGGATLAAGTDGLALANAITTVTSGRINSSSGVLTLNGIVDGAGSLSQIGTGNLVLNGANSFTNLGIEAGTVTLGTNTAAGVGGIALNGGTILAARISGLVLANGMTTTGTGRVDSNTGVFTLGGNIGGTGSITQIGTGNLVLNGLNSFTNLGIEAGTVTLGTSTAAGIGGIALGDGTTLAARVGGLVVTNAITTAGSGRIDSGTGIFTLGGNIGGTGSIAQIGTGNLVLDGVNSFTNLDIAAGTVTLGTDTAAGVGGIVINDGTTLAARVSGLVVTNAITTTGSGRIDSGTGTFTLGGSIGGAGSIIQIGTGNLVLNGANSFTNLGIDAGTVTLGTNTAAGIGGIVLGNGATLAAGVSGLVVANGVTTTGSGRIDSGTGALTLTGAIDGAGSIAQIGTGNLVLNGANSFTNLGIEAGTVTLGSATAAGIGGIALDDGTTLAAGVSGLRVANQIVTTGAGTINSGGGSFTLDGSLTGAGGIAKTGSGTLTLTAASSYTGTTTVASGVLDIAGSLGNNATLVASDATLTGNGSIAGAVTIANGGILSAGAAIGALTVGALTLNETSVVNVALGRADTIAGAFNDLVVVDGDLTLDGSLNVTDSNQFGLGIYELFSYGGTLTDNGLTIASLPGAAAANVQTLVSGQVNLVVTALGTLVQYWDGGDGTGNGAISSSSGSWGTLATNWTGASPSQLNTNWQGGIAVFQGPSGTVTVDDTQSFVGLQFASDGYRLNAGTGGLATDAAGSFVFTATGATATINATIAGSGSLAKQGGGTLVLNGANSYAGNTIIQSGTLVVGSDTAAGTGGVTIGAGTVLAAGRSGLTLANAIVTAGGGRVDSGSGVFTLAGAISGAGSIGKTGVGNLVLNGTNSFVGLGIEQGSVTVGTDTAAGAGGIAISEGGVLAAGVTGLVLTNGIVTTGGGRIDSGSGTFTLAGQITGAGSISQINTGNLVLNGANSFVNLGIDQGRVTVGTDTAAGAGGIAISESGVLAAGVTGLKLTNAIVTTGGGRIDSGSGSFTLAGAISGAGSITQIGTGNLMLNGGNSFVNLDIDQGRVTVGTNTAAGAGDIAISEGGVLAAGVSGLTLTNGVVTTGRGGIDSGSGTFTLAGQITGAGSISQIGTGNLVLNGANSFVNLGIDQGRVTVGTDTAAGAGGIAIGEGGVLAAGVSGLTVTNAIVTTGGSRIDSGAGVFTLSGVIAGAGLISQIGTGNLVLNGANSFANLGIGQGRVTLGTSTSAGIGGIAIDEGGVLAAGVGGLVIGNGIVTTGGGRVDSGAGVLTLNGQIAGAGSISQIGTGNLVLNGANRFNNLGIEAGTVILGTNTAAGIGTIAIGSGATLAAGVSGLTVANAVRTTGAGRIDSGAGVLTLTGSVGGAGSVTKVGAGNLVLGGIGSYTGGTAVNVGRLTVAGTILGPVSLASGTTLAGTGTVGSFSAAAGSTVSPGSVDGAVGTLTVNGNASFAAGSTFAVNILGAAADRLAVSGAASLGGAAIVLTAAGTPVFNTFNQSFVLVSAAGGRTGNFAAQTFTQFGQAFRPTLIYSANDVTLRLAPASLVALQGPGGTANTTALAAALDAAATAGFNPQSFFPLFTQNGASLTASLNQLTGEIGSANARTALADTRYVREAALDRLGAVTGSGGGRDAATTTSSGADYATTLWSRVIGSWSDTDSDGNGASLEIEAKGMIAGVDYSFGDIKAGALFNYVHSDVDTALLGSGKVESTGGGVYAGYRQPSGLAVGAGAAISSVQSESTRSIGVPGLAQTLKAETNGTAYQLFGEIAFDLAASEAVRIEPFARIAYVKYDVDAFSEAGGFAALTQARRKYDATFTTLGLRGSTVIGASASLRGSLGYQHIGGDRSPVASVALQGTTSFADIRGVALDRSSVAAEAGVDFRIGSSTALGVGYSGVVGKDNKDHGVKATLTVGF